MIGLAILAGGLGSRRFSRATDGVKDISLSPKVFDFGKARQGQTLEHEFRLSNGGAVAIVITRVESSCSCTTTENLEGRTIAPGSAIDVPVSIKTGPGDGFESGQITLYFRSAVGPDTPVHFTSARVVADVNPDYRIRPTLIDFGTIDHPGPVSVAAP